MNSITLPKISSYFTHYTPGSRVTGFSNDYYYVIPNHQVQIDTQFFEYSSSPYELAKANKLPSGAVFVLDKERYPYVYHQNSITPLNSFGRHTYLQPSFILSEQNNLFALLSILLDAQTAYEYCDMDEFLTSFSYDIDLPSIRAGEEAYRTIKDTAKRLPYNESQIRELVAILADQGIE